MQTRTVTVVVFHAYEKKNPWNKRPGRSIEPLRYNDSDSDSDGDSDGDGDGDDDDDAPGCIAENEYYKLRWDFSIGADQKIEATRPAL